MMRRLIVGVAVAATLLLGGCGGGGGNNLNWVLKALIAVPNVKAGTNFSFDISDVDSAVQHSHNHVIKRDSLQNP